jgi:hypothetical protein
MLENSEAATAIGFFGRNVCVTKMKQMQQMSFYIIC